MNPGDDDIIFSASMNRMLSAMHSDESHHGDQFPHVSGEIIKRFTDNKTVTVADVKDILAKYDLMNDTSVYPHVIKLLKALGIEGISESDLEG